MNNWKHLISKISAARIACLAMAAGQLFTAGKALGQVKPAKSAFMQIYGNPYLTRYALVVGAGLSGYSGDLNRLADGPLQNYYLNLGLHLGLEYYATNLMAIRYEQTLGQLAARATPGNWGNLAFRTAYWESAVLVVLGGVSRTKMEKYGLHWNPYLFTGVGGLFYHVSTRVDDQVQGQVDGLTNRPRLPLALTFPLGVGLAWKDNGRTQIRLEAAYRFTSADFLDGASLRIDPDPRKDAFFSATLKVTWQRYRHFSYKQYLLRKTP